MFLQIGRSYAPQYAIPHKKEVPDFEGSDDPMVFFNWLTSIEEFFACYDWTNDRKARFAKMKLVGLGKNWWYGVEENIRRLELPPINTWQEMKSKLQEKYMPLNHHEKSCEKVVDSGHGYTSLEVYMQRLETLNTRSQVQEGSRQNFSGYKVGIKPATRRKSTQHLQFNVEHVHEVAPNTKIVVEGNNPTQLKLHSKELVQNLPKARDDQIIKEEKAPIHDLKELVVAPHIVLEETATEIRFVFDEAATEIKELDAPCAIKTDELKEEVADPEANKPLEEAQVAKENTKKEEEFKEMIPNNLPIAGKTQKELLSETVNEKEQLNPPKAKVVLYPSFKEDGMNTQFAEYTSSIHRLPQNFQKFEDFVGYHAPELTLEENALS